MRLKLLIKKKMMPMSYITRGLQYLNYFKNNVSRTHDWSTNLNIYTLNN